MKCEFCKTECVGSVPACVASDLRAQLYIEQQVAIGLQSRAEAAEAQRDELAREVARLRELGAPILAYMDAIGSVPKGAGMLTHFNSKDGHTVVTVEQLQALSAALRGGPAPSGGGKEKR